MTIEDCKIIEAMYKYGGKFAVALSRAAFVADPANLQKIKDTWPEYWAKYSEMAKTQPETKN